ncbi:MAG TPA: hypothetical protein VF453_16460 [Burkholderiaceae bacterium]
MPEVSAKAIAVSIRAVQAEVDRLQEELKTADPEDIPDTQELLLSVSQAAIELKKAYEHALRMSNNLVPYEELIAR